ncbi:MAG TPA: aldehyde ferredoxin oxidoreductase family protein [Candidatus Lokiarchaeia archaeon]|nr:aldehyde ferredoxin oxidoreductase family protein [Candidatus Lokiarchaeia archaeon]
MFGKILRVDLTTRSYQEDQLEELMVRKYLGGRGLGCKILYDELPEGIDPLSPENILVIASGLLTGTTAPSSGRYEVITKSPQTGAIISSNSGGSWGVELRKSGFDALVIKGKADEPVYLWICNGTVEFRDAGQAWGHLMIDADNIIRGETDDAAKVLQIGIAGEQQSHMACIINEKYRAAGRGGVGAVMGSKNLKAVVVKGDNNVQVADPIEFKQNVKKAVDVMENHPAGGGLTKKGGGLNALGTPILVNIINASGMLPTRNFQTGVFEQGDLVSGEKIKEEILTKTMACFRCPMACGRWVKYREGTWGGKQYPETEGESLEYETVWAFSAECGVSDLDAVARANYLCNEYGFDTISTGSTIGFAMELFQRGIITEDDVGFALNFGDADAMIKMLEMMARREGFGNILADGSRAAARKIGNNAEYYAMQVKGLEMPAYDPRGAVGIGLNYATSNRGAAHVNGYTIAAEIAGAPLKMDPLDSGPGKVGLTIAFQDMTAAVDSIGACLFLTFSVGASEFAPLISAALGWDDYSPEEFAKTGARIYALERQFNQREGFGKKDDTLPERLLSEEMPEGPMQGRTHPLEPMLAMYYEQRGYDNEGHPTQEKLEELELQA